MPNTFNNACVRLSTTSITTVYTAPNSSGNISLVLSIMIANVDGTNNADVTVVVTDNSDTILSYLANTITVPADASLEIVSNKLVLKQGQKIRVMASAANDLDVTVSALDIT